MGMRIELSMLVLVSSWIIWLETAVISTNSSYSTRPSCNQRKRFRTIQLIIILGWTRTRSQIIIGTINLVNRPWRIRFDPTTTTFYINTHIGIQLLLYFLQFSCCCWNNLSFNISSLLRLIVNFLLHYLLLCVDMGVI